VQALGGGEEPRESNKKTTMNKLQIIQALMNDNFGRTLAERMKKEGKVGEDFLAPASKNLKRKHLMNSMTSSILHKIMMNPEMIQKEQIIKQMSV